MLRLAIFLCGGLACGAAATDRDFYSIKLNGKLIGYATASREPATVAGKPRVRVRSETTLKVAVLGTERLTQLTSETLLGADGRKLLSYRMSNQTNSLLRHVRCEFDESTVRTWQYRDGDDPGEPTTTPLPEGAVILGSNMFGHWQLLLAQAARVVQDGKAVVPVFLPDGPTNQTFELVRGRQTTVEINGQPRATTEWAIPAASLKLLADAATSELLRMELSSQATTIERATSDVVKQAQKSQAEEILAGHFTKSNVKFDNLLAVRRLHASIDVRVIGSGVGNPPSVLNTADQKFAGRKEGDHITGTVTVRSTSYDAATSPPFPSAPDDSDLGDWLKPAPFIESDDPSIVALAKELTRGQETRWAAVEAIGRWVYQEIAYTIADTPSARLALEKRTGDCGPHSTLMVALLRASGIPSKLVGGVVYTPTFGGSFGQHAWVEVHLGDAGWVAMDPTTGEFRLLSATHIKLFEGMGGVLPARIEVLEFDPPNQKQAPAVRRAAKPMPWKLDTTYTYRFMQDEKSIGTETFRIAATKQGADKAYSLQSEVRLTINALTSLNATTTLTVTEAALPIMMVRQFDVATQKVKIQCDFSEGKVSEKISGSKNLEQDVEIPVGTYCFDNNFMGCWALICSQLTLVPGEPLAINTFHPSSLQVILLTFTPKALAPITIDGEEVMCFECDVAPIKNTFWISQDGRFVRAQQGNLVIELE